MPDLIMADRSDGRIIAGLVTSLVYHWHRLPIGLQTAIISHASETGFGLSDQPVQADRRIIGFIRQHHQALRAEASVRTWAPRHVLLSWLRHRRLVSDVDLEMPDQARLTARWSWADRRQGADPRRHTMSSEIARGIGRARQAIARLATGSR